MHLFEGSHDPLERICVDMIDPFPRSYSGDQWVIVASDHLTLFVETVALPNGSAAKVAVFSLSALRYVTVRSVRCKRS